MSHKDLAKLLDSCREAIEESLPRYFSSADFIKVVKDCFPGEYASLLRQSSYKTLHSWIARWYLNTHFTQIGENEIETIMGHKSPNKMWKK